MNAAHASRFAASTPLPLAAAATLLGVALAMLFYLTPVFYSPEMVPAWARPAYGLNPMTHLLVAYRRILMDGTMPDWWMLLAIAVVDAVLLPIGWATFVRARYTFVEEL